LGRFEKGGGEGGVRKGGVEGIRRGLRGGGWVVDGSGNRGRGG